jgi:hypothetical protein
MRVAPVAFLSSLLGAFLLGAVVQEVCMSTPRWFRDLEARTAPFRSPLPRPPSGQQPASSALEAALLDPSQVWGRRVGLPLSAGGAKAERLVDVKLPYPQVLTLTTRAQVLGPDTPLGGGGVTFTVLTGAAGGADEDTFELVVATDEGGTRRSSRTTRVYVAQTLQVNARAVGDAEDPNVHSFAAFAFAAPGESPMGLIENYAQGDPNLLTTAPVRPTRVRQTTVANPGAGVAFDLVTFSAGDLVLMVEVYNDSATDLRIRLDNVAGAIGAANFTDLIPAAGRYRLPDRVALLGGNVTRIEGQFVGAGGQALVTTYTVAP